MAYDLSLCMLNFFDGNWLFTLPNQCTGQSCSWNVYGAPFFRDMPATLNAPTTYVCDNQFHNLTWPDPSPNPYHPNQNRYSCACGEPLNDFQFMTDKGYNGCFNRCNRPWTAAFGKRCNLITEVIGARGNFTDLSVDTTLGVCENVAGIGTASPSFISPIDPNAFATIDGIGITNVCNGEPFGEAGRGKICTCDGSLPNKAFGKKVVNRNPCSLNTSKGAATTSSPSKWIAAPILIGTVIIAVLFIGYLLYRKRKKSKLQSLQPEEENIALEEIVPTPAPTQALSIMPSGPLTPANSNPSTNTADSGVALLHYQPGTSSKAESG